MLVNLMEIPIREYPFKALINPRNVDFVKPLYKRGNDKQAQTPHGCDIYFSNDQEPLKTQWNLDELQTELDSWNRKYSIQFFTKVISDAFQDARSALGL